MEKPELSQLFSELRIPSIFEVLELFHWKSELFLVLTLKTRTSPKFCFSLKWFAEFFFKLKEFWEKVRSSGFPILPFHWTNSRTSELGKPNFLNLFSELRIPLILEVLFQWKAELRVLFGVLKPRTSPKFCFSLK